MRLLTDYPWYYALGCILLGVGYGMMLYWVKDSNSALSRRWCWMLGALRATTVTILSLLLLSPMVRLDTSVREKPIILIAQDRSESVTADQTADSLWLLKMDALVDRLSESYDVQRFHYGGVTTDMGQIITDLQQQFNHRNVGALILTGDGLWNTGSNPASKVQNQQFPTYTIALGDTSRRMDASISNIRCGRLAYLGNSFPVEVTITASLLKGERKRLTLSQGGRILFQKMIDYQTEVFSITEQVEIDAEKPGVQRYNVRIEPADGEVTLQNNERSFSVEVIDGHQKIAIIAAVPHPDVSALKRSIENSPNYEVEAFLAKDFKGRIQDYSLLILHEIPSRGGVRLSAGDVPCIYVLGSQSDISQFNALRTGLEINTRLNKTNEVQAVFCAGFSPFSMEESTLKALEEMPPLTSLFGDYRLGSGMQCLLTAKIGSLDSKQPLIAVGQQQGVRQTIIAGEGLWRWRLADYQSCGSHEHFDELVSKLVTYTAMRVDKDRFRLSAKSIYRQDEDVVVEAELYDENYELTNKPEATLILKGKEYSFNRSGDRYILNLGQLAPDAYGCSAHCIYSGKEYQSGCTFVVEEMNLESLNLTADHALMQAIAASTDGQMLLPDDVEKLPEMLADREEIKPLIYSHTRYVELIDRWWVMLLLVVLLGIEWITRKYNGEL